MTGDLDYTKNNIFHTQIKGRASARRQLTEVYALAASWAATRRDSYYGTFMDPNAFGETENDLLVLDGLVNRYFGYQLVSFGGQFSRDDLLDAGS